MKKEYIVPEMEITQFETEDVITASNFTNGGNAEDYSGDGDIQIP